MHSKNLNIQRRKIGSIKTGEIETGFAIQALGIPAAWGNLVSAVDQYGTLQRCPPEYDPVGAYAIFNVSLTIAKPSVRPWSTPAAGLNDEDMQAYWNTYFFQPQTVGDLQHTYGNRLNIPCNQFEKCIEILSENPSSRRAVMLIARLEDLFSDVPPCVRELQFFVPAGQERLYTSVYMRSWDVFGASLPDIGSFQLSAEYIAENLGRQTGPLTVFAVNAHIYSKQLQMYRSGQPPQKSWAQKLAKRSK